MATTALLCYDGSEGATRAIEEAARLLGGGDAVVLSVGESLASAVFQGRGDSLPEHAEALRLAEEGAAAATAAGFAAQPAARVSPAAAGDCIIAVAEERDVDVIVVGARGLSAARSILLGSVSHHVVQRARTPVLVVHPPRDAA